MKPYHLLPLILIVLGAAPPAGVQRRTGDVHDVVLNTRNPFPEFALDVQVDPTYPTRLPIRLTIKITNRGKTRAGGYWCGGPGRYPSLRGIQASVVQEGGKATLAPLSNGQCEVGSGQALYVEPGESMRIPGVLPPLSKGSYTIQIGNAKSVQVKVSDDPALLKKHEAALLAGVRKGDPVAQHAAGMCRLRSLQKALLLDLTSDNDEIVTQASRTLSMSQPDLPADAGKYVSKAMRRAGPQSKAIWHLGRLAERIGTDDMLDDVIDLTRSDRLDREERRDMVHWLSMFKQEKSRKSLRDLLKDSDEVIRFSAAQNLADFKHGDAKALDVLVTIAEDAKNEKRGAACWVLTNYPAEPRAERAIRSRLKDADGNVRHDAAWALDNLLRAREQR